MKYAIMMALREVTDQQLAEVCVRMADIHTPTFERILMEVISGEPARLDRKQEFKVPFSDIRVSFSKKELQDIIATGLAGNKISGIKIIREITKIGLKEAKDLYEGMVDDGIIILKPYDPTY